MVRNSIIASSLLIFTGIPSLSQPDVSERIVDRFTSYCSSFPREDIYLHTDRKEYIAGETLWFNAYLFDRQSIRLSSSSSIAYVELLDAGNKPVSQKRILLKGGTGSGIISLPDTLASGIYTVRAYTRWMRNFLPDNCFLEDIKIYNAFNIKSFTSKRSLQEIPDTTTESSDNDTSAVKPSVRIAEVNRRGSNIELTVEANKAGNFRSGSKYFLLVQTHGNIDLVRKVAIEGYSQKLVISGDSLRSGINHITLFDSTANPVTEKLIYTPASTIAPVISAIANDTLEKRGSITCRVSLGSDTVMASMSASVSAYPLSSGVMLDDYLVFGSEYGPAPFEKINGRRLGEMTGKEIDEMLMKLKSNWIIWEEILSDALTAPRYEREKNWHYIDGILASDYQYPGSEGKHIMMSIPGKTAQFQYAVTGSDSRFAFRVPIDEVTRDLILQPEDTTFRSRIFIESSFPGQYQAAASYTDSVALKDIPRISEMSMHFQVGKIYETTDREESPVPDYISVQPRRFYGKPDIGIHLKDFIKLPSMKDVFYELIPHVRINKYGTLYDVEFTDIYGNRIYEEPPVLMIDGVIIWDAGIIARLDPEIVEKIDVIRGHYQVGNHPFHGIVNVITNAGNFVRLPVPGFALRFSYRAVDPVINFFSRDYPNSETFTDRIPDLRNTLFWDPEVKPGSDGNARFSFRLSDAPSEMEITINGVTGKGRPFSARKTIKAR